jgi:hypothetical protein
LKRIALILLGLIVLMPSNVAASQEEEPEPGTNAAADLPDATVFGTGWVQDEVISPDAIEQYGFAMSPDVFREGAAGIYLGPEGSRALVVRFLLTDNRVAIRTSWDDAGELLESLTLFVSTDYERDQQLETLPPPEGCLEARRVEGSERVFRLPAGATLCAADDDSLFMVIIYGEVNGASGIEASDLVTSAIVTA